MAAVNLGFTGTRNGMTEAQKIRCTKFVRRIIPAQATHGDCLRADAEFHDIVRLVMPSCFIQIYPSTHVHTRAYKAGDLIHEPRPPLERNPLIVQASNLLLATPATMHEVIRSGTWATIRYARRNHMAIYILWPNGEMGYEQE